MSKQFNAIIIDDESDARDTLSVLLEDYCPSVTILSVAKDLPSGVKAIHKYKPDVIFLDIEMPEYSGLEILDFFDPEHIHFQIIFTTAYSEYAVQAFELSAIDYILKPIQIDQLKKAVAKLEDTSSSNTSGTRLNTLKSIISNPTDSKRFVLPVSDGLIFVQTEDIIYLKADRSYTEFHMKDGKCITVSKNLKEYDSISMDQNFFRIHRSYIINMLEITHYLKSEGGFVVLSNGEKIPVSPDKKSLFLNMFNG
jgi:two-component system LytT family response regulator